MNKSVMKCCICNNENIGQFITINNKKYHLCCIEQLQQENQELKSQLKGTTHCFDEEEHRKLQENYDRIYSENCKLREEHNINDISLLDENYRLKKGIYRIYDYLEDKYGCSAVKGIINDTDVAELYEILDEVLK